jgi:hypothetical protein
MRSIATICLGRKLELLVSKCRRLQYDYQCLVPEKDERRIGTRRSTLATNTNIPKNNHTEKTIGLRPTIFTYVPLIHGWAALGQVERAESFLREWFEQNHHDETAPEGNYNSYSSNRKGDTRTKLEK